MSKVNLDEWLRCLVLDETIPGVRWYNEEDRSFSITWNNYSKESIAESDKNIFYLYAKRSNMLGKDPTGKYWKHNLRSAILRYSKKNIIKFLYKKDGCRVYQFVKKQREARITLSFSAAQVPTVAQDSGESSRSYSGSPQSTMTDLSQGSTDTNPCTTPEQNQDSGYMEVDDIYDFDIDADMTEYLQKDSGEWLEDILETLSGSGGLESSTSNFSHCLKPPNQCVLEGSQVNSEDINDDVKRVATNKFLMIAFYCGKIVTARYLESGVEITYASQTSKKPSCEDAALRQKMFGNCDAERVNLPEFKMHHIPSDFRPGEDRQTLLRKARETLAGLTSRGLDVTCTGGNISALRLSPRGVTCRAQGTKMETQQMPRPKSRNTNIPILELFDYRTYVYQLQEYKAGKRETRPPMLVHFGLGSRPTREALIRVAVISDDARLLLQDFNEDVRIDLDMYLCEKEGGSHSTLVSKTDTLDVLAECYDNISLINPVMIDNVQV